MIGDAEPRAAARQAAERDRDLADEAEHRTHRLARGEDAQTDAPEPRRNGHPLARALPLRDGFGERDQALRAGRKAVALDRHVPARAELGDVGDEGQQARVPCAERRGVERESGGGRRRELALDRRGARHVALQLPSPAEMRDERRVAVAAERQRRTPGVRGHVVIRIARARR